MLDCYIMVVAVRAIEAEFHDRIIITATRYTVCAKLQRSPNRQLPARAKCLQIGWVAGHTSSTSVYLALLSSSSAALPLATSPKIVVFSALPCVCPPGGISNSTPSNVSMTRKQAVLGELLPNKFANAYPLCISSVTVMLSRFP